jgi:hypothetical protein
MRDQSFFDDEPHTPSPIEELSEKIDLLEAKIDYIKNEIVAVGLGVIIILGILLFR